MAFFELPRLNWRRVVTIVRKELLVLLCNRVSRVLIIVPPLMQIVIFGWAATMEVRNVDVAVLDHDNGRWSREIVHRLEGSPTFRSVRFLPAEESIRPVLEGQQALFILVFDQEFSRRVDRGESAQAQVILDGRRSNAAQIAAYYLNRIIEGMAADTPLGRASATAAASSPRLDVRMRCGFNPNLEFQWFFLPNLIGMLSLMLGLVVTGLSVAREREVGTFDRRRALHSDFRRGDAHHQHAGFFAARQPAQPPAALYGHQPGRLSEGHHLCGGGLEPGQDHPDQHGHRGRGRVDVQAPDVSGPQKRAGSASPDR